MGLGMNAAANALAATPVETVADALDVMEQLDAALAPSDGVWSFNRLYWRVTLAVDASLHSGGWAWRDPEFIRILDVVFANLYFSALRAAGGPPAVAPSAWRALFEARHRSGVARIQFALAGMNAHINRDLVAAVTGVCEQLGIHPAHGTDQYADFTSVNALLETVQEQVKHEFATELVGVADEALGRLDDLLATWSVDAAREAAWCNAEIYWALPDIPLVEATFLRTLDRTVALVGRGLLIPLGVP